MSAREFTTPSGMKPTAAADAAGAYMRSLRARGYSLAEPHKAPAPGQFVITAPPGARSFTVLVNFRPGDVAL